MFCYAIIPKSSPKATALCGRTTSNLQFSCFTCHSERSEGIYLAIFIQRIPIFSINRSISAAETS
jgi:hypothetical protein